MAVSGASGATFTATNLNDAGADSLRQAVVDANGSPGADTIEFQAGLTGTISLTSGPLTLTDSVTITGPGANVVTVSGNNASRVFEVNGGVTAAISGLTIANGSTNAGGAGIYTEGVLTLTGCIFQNNTDTSSTGGGGVLGGGGAALTVTGCLFTVNQAVYGAAIEYYSGTQAVITNVTVSGNTISGGEGGVIDVLGAIRLESCTVTGNSVPANSAAVYAFGGTVQYRNTIVSANTPNQFGGGGLTSLGHNISSDGTGNLLAPGDLTNTNPLLGPLADNGGPTLTHALLPGSPAIDAADTATFPATDQRGIARPLGMLNCMSVPDIGAVEGVPADCNHNYIADACDIAAPHIYWANDTADVIQRAVALPANFNVQTVASVGSGAVRAVAVDPVNAQVYWGLADGAIRRSNLDGSGVVTLVSGTAARAVDIALDFAGGWMYWANFPDDVIYRADLSGGGVTTLVTGQFNVSGITLDLAGGKMYWVNQTGNGQIRRANLDGTNIETLINSGLTGPIDITLDITGGRMYWAEYAGARIRRANLDGSNMQNLATGATNAAGIDLDLAAGKVYWSSATLNKIERANLDGTSREDVITGSGAIYRIDLIPQVADCNGNGIPDNCEPNLHRGDMNCDCAVNLADVPGFIEAVLDPVAYAAAHPTCSITNGDTQPDGQVNGLDVQAFVDVMMP